MAQDYMDEDPEKLATTNEIEFTKYAFECRSAFEDWYTLNISQARSNKKFVYGDQWDAETKNKRASQGKESLQNNVIRPIIRTMIAEQRAIDPQVNVYAADTDIPSEKVELISGLWRQISYDSDSKIVYSYCYRDMIDAGYGGMELCVEKQEGATLNKVLRIRSVKDVLKCFWDPSAKNMFKTDGNFAGKEIEMSMQEFRKRWPDKAAEYANFSSGNSGSKSKTVLLLQFYLKCHYNVQVYILEDGTELSKEEYEELEKQYMIKLAMERVKYEEFVKIAEMEGVPPEKIPPFQPKVQQLPPIEKKKTTNSHYIMSYLLCKNHVLQKQKLATKFIPLVFVPGDLIEMDGAEVTIPYSIDAESPQRAINYLFSEILYSVNTRIRSKVFATNTQVGAHTNQWDYPNRAWVSTFTPDPMNPQPPQLINPPAIDAGMLTLYQQFIGDVKDMLAQRGEQADDASGTALLTEEILQGSARGVYADNLNLAIGHITKIGLSMLPSVYDTERTVVIRKADGELDYKVINKTIYQMDSNGELMVDNDLTHAADYLVEVFGGPSYAAQRIFAVNFLERLAGMDPQIMPLVIDEIMKNAPFVFSNKLIKRFQEKIMPPDIVALEAGQQPPPQQPSPQEELMNLEKLNIISKITGHLGKNNIEQQKVDIEKERADAEMLESVSKGVTAIIDDQAKIIESFASVQKAEIEATGQENDHLEAIIDQMLRREETFIDASQKNLSMVQ